MTKTDPHRPNSPYEPKSDPPWRWLLVLGALVIAGIFIIQAVQAPWSGDANNADENKENSTSINDGSPESSPVAKSPTTSIPNSASAQAYVDQVASEQAAIALADTTRVLREGERAVNMLENTIQNVIWWQSQGEALLTNDLGRRIASDREQTRKFALLRESADAVVGRQDVEALQAELEALLGPLQSARDTPGSTYRPSDSIKQAISAATARASSLNKTWSEHRQNLDAVLLAGRSLPTTSSTLLETINKTNQEAAQRRLAEIVAAEETARDDAAKEMAELRAKLANERAESERRLAEAEAELEQTKIEQAAADRAAEAQRVAAQAERERMLQAEAERKAEMVALAQSPENKEIFAPFTNPGIYQPKTTMHGRGKPPRPISFAELGQYGALEQTEEGLSRLLRVVNNRSNAVRGSWPEPTTPEDWAEIRRRQALLRELGPTMVELELLSP